MAKYLNSEAYFSRLQELAQTDKKAIKEQRNIGTLIDYKKDVNGVAYGIVKENHNYFIKKGTRGDNLNASDFAYIGGLENIKMYQYHSITEAEKHRDLLFHSINEAAGLKTNKSVNKLILNEDVAGSEIEKSEDQLGDLDAATAEKNAAVATPSVPDLGDDQPIPDEEIPAGDVPDLGSEEPAGEEMPDAEMPIDGDAPEGEEMPDAGEEGDAGNQEIAKKVGEVAELVRDTQMDDSQVKSYVNSFLAAFKEKFPDIDISDRKKMADKLIKVVDQGEINDLEASMPADEVDEETCDECGSFTKFAESRGYNQDSIKTCSVDEMASLISGYANAHNEGLNEGCGEEVALYTNEEVIESLVNEYGHDDYVNEIIKPEIMKLSESTDEDKNVKIDELWGGLKRAASSLGTGLKDVANTAYNKAKEVGGEVKQQYRKGVQNDKVNAVNKLAQELKGKIDAMNAATAKAGGTPLDLNTILDILKKQLAGAPAGLNQGAQNAWNIGKKNTLNAHKLEEMGVDAGNTLAKPEMIQEDDEIENDEFDVDNLNVDDENGDEEITTPEVDDVTPETGNEIGFAAPQSLGVGVPTTQPAQPTSVTIDGNNKTVSISMNEAKAGKYPNGHVLATKSTIKSEPEKISTPTTNTKGVEKVAKKTEGHVLANKSTIATKPVKTEMIKEEEVDEATINNGHSLASKTSFTGKAKTGVIKEEKPSAGLTKDEKSDVVKKAKAGEDIGKKGKSFENVADKAAKEYGSKEKGEKVAAAAMWKNKAKSVKEEVNESETKIRKYIRQRLEEKAGMRKANLNESVKSEQLKKLDKLIDEQYEKLKTK